MKTKAKNTNIKKIECVIVAVIIILLIVAIYNNIIIRNDSFATETLNSNNKDYTNIEISNAEKIKLETINDIIKENTNVCISETIETKEEALEYITKYKTNTNLPKGAIQVVQEGQEGIQQISIKKTYENNILISEEEIGKRITKSSIDKIVEVGGANYTSYYKVKVGDTIYVTSDRLPVMYEPNTESIKITTLTRNDKLKVKQIIDGWYRISYLSTTGWVKQENTTYINPNKDYIVDSSVQKSKNELLKNLSFNMSLNKPSGLSLEQFKKVLTDSKDTNKIFQNNAEYFYYIEKQYNINGIFVAAIGIHESAWGTSKIARDKNNLFGYGAYDSNPYNGAYTFATYSESIDLIARVLVKYYLNPQGTKIYSNEIASGMYYNGNTVSGVNKKYATDKNWANAVYTHMKYLYGKL